MHYNGFLKSELLNVLRVSWYTFVSVLLKNMINVTQTFLSYKAAQQ